MVRTIELAFKEGKFSPKTGVLGEINFGDVFNLRERSGPETVLGVGPVYDAVLVNDAGVIHVEHFGREDNSLVPLGTTCLFPGNSGYSHYEKLLLKAKKLGER